MSTTDVLANLKIVFSDVLGEDDLDLNDATTADDVEAWDSLAHVRLIVAIEQEFSIRFDMAEVGQLANVGELRALIERKLG